MAMSIVLLSWAAVEAADEPAWQGFANAWIASHAMRVKGQAPREKRLGCEGDLNGDGKPDTVVVYTIEGVGGGNDWTQYATVLTATPQGYGATLPKEVGGKSLRAIDGCSVNGGILELALKEYAPTDASCCPSQPGRARFAFATGVLTAVPAPTRSAS